RVGKTAVMNHPLKRAAGAVRVRKLVVRSRIRLGVTVLASLVRAVGGSMRGDDEVRIRRSGGEDRRLGWRQAGCTYTAGTLLVLLAPELIPLVALVGFARALATAAAVLLVMLLAVAIGVMRRAPEVFGLGPDGDPVRPVLAPASVGRGRGDALRTWRFWSVSA